MPADVNLRDNVARKELYDQALAATPKEGEQALKARVLLLSGCQDNQTSADGDRNGLFTGTLREVWADGAFEGGVPEVPDGGQGRHAPVAEPELPAAQRPEAHVQPRAPVLGLSRHGTDRQHGRPPGANTRRHRRAGACGCSASTRRCPGAPGRRRCCPCPGSRCGPGPVGSRIAVLDYAADGTRTPGVDLDHPYLLATDGLDPDESDPQFHQQMVYAVLASLLETLDNARGRRLVWRNVWRDSPRRARGAADAGVPAPDQCGQRLLRPR